MPTYIYNRVEDWKCWKYIAIAMVHSFQQSRCGLNDTYAFFKMILMSYCPVLAL